MATIKQKTVETGTMKLVRLKNDRKDLSNSKYRYFIEFPDGDRKEVGFNKEEAMMEFDQSVELRSTEGSSESSGFLGGMF